MNRDMPDGLAPGVLRSLAAGMRRSGVYMRSNPILMIILLIAVLLRLSVIFWGLPVGYSRPYHPDEFKYLAPALSFHDFYLTSKPFPMYGTSVQYTIGLLLLPLHGAFKLLGPGSGYEVLGQLICRLSVVASGVLSVLLIHRLGARLFDHRTGIIAAAFLSVSVYHALNSAVFTLDVPMSALLLVNILICLRMLERDTLLNYLVLGIATGYLIGTKFTAAVFVAFPVTLLILGGWPNKDKMHLIKGMAICCASATITFIVFSPQYVIGFNDIYAYIMNEKVDFVDRTEPGSLLAAAGSFLNGITTALGWPVTVLAITGMLRFGASHWRSKLSLLAIIFLYSLFFRHFMHPRYVIFIAPLFCLFAAHACSALFGSKHRISKALAVVLIAFTFGQSGFFLVNGIGSRLTDSRVGAAKFLDKSYHGKTRIAFSLVSEKYPNTHSWRYPRLKNSGHTQVSLLDDPDVIVTSSFDMEKIEAALGSGYLSSDYQWAPAQKSWWYRYSAPSPRLFRFYDQLLSDEGEYRLVKVFPAGPGVGEFAPPEIRIYERDGLRVGLEPLE
jgi:4-amino-4-deoxy-L-arabinose transferase-like glycosyltransferase